MGSASAGPHSLGSGFFQLVVENRLRMRRGPSVRQHLFQMRILCVEPQEKIADVSPGINAMTLGTGQDRVQHGGSWAGGFTAQE